jgi:hypothetical protein
MQAFVVLGKNVFRTAVVEKTEEVPTLQAFADQVYTSMLDAEPVSLELEDGAFLVIGGEAIKDCYMRFSETP